MKTLTKKARLEDIEAAVMADGQVRVRGFGTFYLGKVGGKTWVSPKTGKAHDVPEQATIRLRLSKAMRSRMKVLSHKE